MGDVRTPSPRSCGVPVDKPQHTRRGGEQTAGRDVQGSRLQFIYIQLC